MGNHKRNFTVFHLVFRIGLFFIFFSHMYPALAQQEIIPLKVEWKEQRLSVIAEKVPLSDILCRVSRQTRIEMHGLEYLQEPVSIRFSGLTLHESLKKLLAHVNYAIFMRTTPRDELLLTRLLIIGSQPASSLESIVFQENEKSEGELFYNNLRGLDLNTRLVKIQELLEINHPHIEDILYSATRDSDPLIREIAYKQLYERGYRRVADLLLNDSRSSNADVRKTAISLLGELYGSGELFGSDAVEILKGATEDEDTDIRHMAFNQLSHLSPQDGLIILKARLTHSDPEIRIMAIEAMASKGEECAFEAARSALYDSDELVRSKAEGLMYELEARKEVRNE